MYKNNKPAGKGSLNRLVVMLGLGILATLITVSIVSCSNTNKSDTEGVAAFGKLPLPTVGATGESRLMVMPEIDNGIEPMMPEMKYVWEGGGFPNLADKMTVHRMASPKMSLEEAKRIAASFGIKVEPVVEEPVRMLQEDLAEGPKPMKPEPKEIEPAIEPAPYNIYSFFEGKGGKRLDIYEADRRFSYSIDGGFEAAEKSTLKLPNKDAAGKIAKKFLADKGLMPTGTTGPFVQEPFAFAPDGPVSSDGNPEDVVEKTPYRPSYINVHFGKKLGGYDVVEPSGEASIYVMFVSIGPGGEVLSASGELPAKLEESPYPLMSTADAFEEVKKGAYGPIRALDVLATGQIQDAAEPAIEIAPLKDADGQIDDSEGGVSPGNEGLDKEVAVPDAKNIPTKQITTTVKFNKVTLGYMFTIGPDDFRFYVPVYVFSGTMIDPAGNTSDYSVSIPAVSTKYIAGK